MRLFILVADTAATGNRCYMVVPATTATCAGILQACKLGSATIDALKGDCMDVRLTHFKNPVQLILTYDVYSLRLSDEQANALEGSEFLALECSSDDYNDLTPLSAVPGHGMITTWDGEVGITMFGGFNDYISRGFFSLPVVSRWSA